LNCEDPPDFDWISTEDHNQRHVKVEFATPIPPNMAKVEARASNEPAMSNYYRFAQVVLSLPLMERIDADFGLRIEKAKVASLMGHVSSLSYMPTAHYGIN